jgi:HEPN domain-containing protein
MYDDRSQDKMGWGLGPGLYSRKRSSSREDRNPKRRDHRNYRREDSRGDPYKLDYLVNLKQFQEYFMRNSTKTDEEEMLKRFQVYKENFTRKQNEKFFLKFKDSEWFREKYHPDESHKKKLCEKRGAKSKEFEVALKNGEYDSISFEANESRIDLSLKKCLYLTRVPDYLKREELEQVLKETSGFKELVLSDPRIDKNMARSGWVYFEDGVELEDVCKQLDNFKVILIVKVRWGIILFV